MALVVGDTTVSLDGFVTDPAPTQSTLQAPKQRKR
jgi:hypothetical protein